MHATSVTNTPILAAMTLGTLVRRATSITVFIALNDFLLTFRFRHLILLSKPRLRLGRKRNDGQPLNTGGVNAVASSLMTYTYSPDIRVTVGDRLGCQWLNDCFNRCVSTIQLSIIRQTQH